MTRFARYKCSKSSNERVPEAATPWSVLSKQFDVSKSNTNDDREARANFESQRKENYEKFLKEEALKINNESWCEFSETSNNGKMNTDLYDKRQDSINRLKKRKKLADGNDESKQPKEKKAKKMVTGSVKINSKKTPNKISKSDSEDNFDVDDPEMIQWCNEVSDEETSLQYQQLTKQLKKICKKNDMTGKKKEDCGKKKQKAIKKKKGSNDLNHDVTAVEDKVVTSMHEPLEETATSCNDNKLKMKNKKKLKYHGIQNLNETISDIPVDKIKSKTKYLGNNTPVDTPGNDNNKTKTGAKKLDETISNIPVGKIKSKTKHLDDNTSFDTVGNNNKKFKGNENVQIADDDCPSTKKKKGQRRKPIPDIMHIKINGEDVPIVNLQGFPVTSKDAERILELKKTMISKGIPRSEVDRTIKLERRRAEKSLARLKKNLCFHCRKGGHLLSECPEMDKEGKPNLAPASGLCFKCGSTEHTHFNCKVVRTQDYKFAQCFVCKEQGHISRQCPDNPKGVYPKGGACRVCGDVTHLRKDCPKVMQDNEKNAIRLETLQNHNIEDIDSSFKAASQLPAKSNVKHVRF